MKGHSKRRKMVSGDVGKLLGAGFISVALLLAGCTSGNEQSLGSGNNEVVDKADCSSLLYWT